jgi:hypothetical protein
MTPVIPVMPMDVLPPLDVTEEDGSRAWLKFRYRIPVKIGAELVCRERQLLTALKRVAELEADRAALRAGIAMAFPLLKEEQHVCEQSFLPQPTAMEEEVLTKFSTIVDSFEALLERIPAPVSEEGEQMSKEICANCGHPEHVSVDGTQSCGICLNEFGKQLRTLDKCCSHYSPASPQQVEREHKRKIQRPGLLEAARLLRTDGVLLSIIPGETKSDHVIRFAIAFAEKLENLAS